MRIVYRMTGLSGDATEDIIDTLDNKGADALKNDEEVYRMADELAHCGGALEVMNVSPQLINKISHSENPFSPFFSNYSITLLN
jgi:hypothetical protein